MKSPGADGWKEYFDEAKNDYCNCIDEARSSTRNIEKQERQMNRCHIELQNVYEEFEDVTSLSDEEFEDINKYIQKVYNEPCK